MFREVPNDDYDGTTINIRGSEGLYLWVCSFEGWRSMGFRPFDSVSMRFARLIVILTKLGDVRGEEGNRMILGLGH